MCSSARPEFGVPGSRLAASGSAGSTAEFAFECEALVTSPAGRCCTGEGYNTSVRGWKATTSRRSAFAWTPALDAEPVETGLPFTAQYLTKSNRLTGEGIC